MLTVEALTGWLQSLPTLQSLFNPESGTAAVAVSPEPGWQPLDIPGPLIVITVTPGGPTLAERTFDQIAVQLMIRGGQADSAGTEAMVAQIDNAIMAVVPPVTVGDTRVNLIDYRGGPPRWVARDNSRRHHWAANYVFRAARTVF